MNPSGKIVRIGGGSAFFDDSFYAHPALIASGVDYLVYDYLAELSMASLAGGAAGAPDGFSPLFLRDFRPHLRAILDSGAKIVTNWGGLNPQGAADALRGLLDELELKARIGTVCGDDLRPQLDALRARGITEMFSGEALPDEVQVASANAYLGAFPIAAAFDAGAEIVITGRVVDSALALGPLIHEFGWGPDDYDQLASGTLVGHLTECSTQATGGTFTDWEQVPEPENPGNPIAECRADGSFVMTKPEGTGGLVSIGTIGEQMIYEVGDPQGYIVPDVVCDFSDVTLEDVGENRVRVQGTRGYPPTDSYKVCLTYAQGWRGRVCQPIIGMNAAGKARRQAAALEERTNRILRDHNQPPLSDFHLHVIGAEDSYGARARAGDSREVVAMMTAEHDDLEGVEVFIKEQTSAISGMAPGTSLNLGGAYGKDILPRLHVFLFLLPRGEIEAQVAADGLPVEWNAQASALFAPDRVQRPPEPDPPVDDGPFEEVPLVRVAWARSGDKGNLFNVGVFARDPRFYPWILAALTSEAVTEWYDHLFDDPEQARVERFLLPGPHGINFLVHDSLGGGGSLCARLDPVAKSMGQMLLEFPVRIPRGLVE